MLRTTPMVLLALTLAACGTRPVQPSDGGALDQSPAWNPEDGPRLDSGLVRPPDACVRPPGSCHSQADCPSGSECVCGADPCCPMCDICLGTCRPKTTCVHSADCKPTDFCSLAACGQLLDPPGQCIPRPSGCADVYTPVCGCDGKTYGNECEAHMAGVSVKAKSSCCDGLSTQYATLLTATKKCCALCAAPVNPCQQLVESVLGCGCLTSANTYAPELAMLKTVAAQWATLGCQTPCPAVTCPKISGGSCQPAPGSSGTCTDSI